jgi:hypothetical protein
VKWIALTQKSDRLVLQPEKLLYAVDIADEMHDRVCLRIEAKVVLNRARKTSESALNDTAGFMIVQHQFEHLNISALKLLTAILFEVFMSGDACRLAEVVIFSDKPALQGCGGDKSKGPLATAANTY